MSTYNIKRICVITNNYPSKKIPEQGAFVEKMVRNWQNIGVNVDVLAPISIPDIIRNRKNKTYNINNSGNNIIRTKYLSIPNINNETIKSIRRELFINAVKRGYNKISNCDVLYGKFMLKGGLASCILGQKNRKPVFIDLGESNLIESMSKREYMLSKYIIKNVNGIICVSDRLRNEAIELGAKESNIYKINNNVDLNIFKKYNKYYCRKLLNIPKESFIVIFVGHFRERKGPMKVLKAINKINHPVKGIFIGRGKHKPQGDKVFYTGSVINSELPYWLNASDVFVLPSLAEGNCNAINEAMACGLPIITSNISDIRDQVNNKFSYLIDPNNIDMITNTISELINNDTIRNNMSHHAIREAQYRFKVKREEKILQWMNNKLIDKS